MLSSKVAFGAALCIGATVDAFAPGAVRIGGTTLAKAGSVSLLKTSSLSLSAGRTARHSTLSSLRAATDSLADTLHPVRSDAAKVTLSTSTTKASAYKGELLIVPLAAPAGEDKEALSAPEGDTKEVDETFDGAVVDLIASSDFKGGAGTAATVRLAKGSNVKKLSVVGTGKADKFDTSAAIKYGAQIAALAKSEKVESLGVVLPTGLDSDQMAALTEAFYSGLYQDSRFKTGDGKPKPLKLSKVELLGCDMAGVDKTIKDAMSISAGVSLCKDLVSAPANYVTPGVLADEAQLIAKETGLECTILDQKECEKLKMGSYLAVAKGSSEPPKFIHLVYKPKGANKDTKKVAVVGKGLTFDSGGYNIKAGPASMIEMMKFDMGGSGATLGAARAIGLLKPDNVEAHFIVASCENMINGEAMRPGDILTASNGKTIEVLNTDAEGRLTLADALIYAEKQGATEIVDVATLTGACIVSLGMDYAGMWSNNDDLAKALETSSKTTGEKMWRMPLCEAEYGEQIKSKIADIKNLGGKGAGSITAALFLKEFVDKSAWAHLDIAGPVWSDKSGATGYGVKTLTDWVINAGKKSD
mmetsp:Transcript_40116/g.78632  ORF Transcript_40116/g.78632 Transcript_40116/m.78632 type:complete len:587 (-) Transcript_40116:380-2140(-)